MIKQILKILWNDKKHFGGILLEQGIVFIVLVICIFSILKKNQQYNTPGNLAINNMVMLTYMHTKGHGNQYEIYMTGKKFRVIMDNIMNLPYVNNLSRSMYFAPYLRGDALYPTDTINIDGYKIRFNLKVADDATFIGFRPKLIEGDWALAKNLDDGSFPIIINKQFAEEVKWQTSVGRKLNYEGITYTIVGVVDGIKQQLFSKSTPTIVMPIMQMRGLYMGEFCINVKEGYKDELIGEFLRQFKKIISDSNVEPVMVDMDRMQKIQLIDNLFLVAVMAIPTLFFLIFAFIGTFGLFWLNSKRKRTEYALRLAIGSSKKCLLLYVVTESVLVTLLAILPGLILIILLYGLNPFVIISILISCSVLLMFSIFSSWLPAYKTSTINPANVLHYE